MPVLDATLLVAADRRPKGIAPFIEALAAEGEPMLVPVQAAIEYATGRPDPAEAFRKIQEAFRLVPCGPGIALETARLARAAFEKGAFPGWSDIQVAATARHEGMAVVTRNSKHFLGLGLEVRSHP